MLRSLLAALLVLLLAACGDKASESPREPPSATTPDAAPDRSPIDAALLTPDRLPGDTSEDDWRKPAEVLAMLEIKPGMRVLDYFSGGGYYAELLARVVGPEGQVIAYNNEPYKKYAGEKLAERYARERLPNVAQLTAKPEELPIDAQSIDAVLIVNAYHDLHWQSKDGSWPPTDAKAALNKLATALKPGGTVVVVDHVATAGSDPAVSVDTLHRIDPEIIKRDFEAAGLTFERESNVLRNPSDDHAMVVFDPSVRHKTDQVIYRFRKA